MVVDKKRYCPKFFKKRPASHPVFKNNAWDKHLHPRTVITHEWQYLNELWQIQKSIPCRKRS
jgi:hypothetical protein